MIRWICIVILLLSGVPARGQGAGASAPAQDSLYTVLLQEEQVLRVRTDSLLNVIDRQRELLRADTTDLRARSQAILRLEETVFALRNRMGVVASKINGIEQEYILNNLLRPAAEEPLVPVFAADGSNLIDHPYFRENLSADEYRQVRAGKAVQPQLDRLVSNYRSDYRELENLVEAYARETARPAADSIYARYRRLVARIQRTEREFEQLWGERYDQEIYLYSYLLDKLNRMEDLAALNEQSRDRPVFDAGQVMSTALAAYPGQRSLLTGYELALADALKFSAAADSLRRIGKMEENPALPKIELKEKEFVPYENISFPEASPYTAENPIPVLEIPETGTCYSVMVGTFSQRQAVSIFRGAVPLSYRRAGTQWRYFAGLFRSYGDVAEAVEQLEEAGFRRPEAVRWRDGVYTNLAEEAAEKGGLFRVEIRTAGELPEDIRGVLARYARGKEITRIGDLFYAGTFTNSLQADEVVEELKRIGIEAERVE